MDNNNHSSFTTFQPVEEKPVSSHTEEKTKKSNMFSSFFEKLKNKNNTQSENLQSSARFTKRNMRHMAKKYLPTAILAIAVILVAVAVRNSLTNTSGSNARVAGAASQPELLPVIAHQDLHREFNFSLKNASDVEVGKLNYSLEEANLRKEIIVKGQKATAVKGRAFLIISLKITNKDNKSIIFNARDYVRLSINNSGEWLAPDIHNDPVEVQAISTKLSSLGFPINESDKNLVLQVGEVKGAKTYINLSLR